jgi:hypothetical protein
MTQLHIYMPTGDTYCWSCWVSLKPINRPRGAQSRLSACGCSAHSAPPGAPTRRRCSTNYSSRRSCPAMITMSQATAPNLRLIGCGVQHATAQSSSRPPGTALLCSQVQACKIYGYTADCKLSRALHRASSC